ncbi:unnamed protein product (macronuclear) [Paramecium tetraurelia]|uniref:Bromo domain-containing protein n=1 Tax=Paramecium tetraurelia TaxID=5888 RepID=A0CSQ1_PARTE|nr:uncharacterized protein GSPATT00010090001 [Paramecium tetraurelia]CAK73818.1 unnamed protein product [Paramecium tetraurelia]|eukprot:XP_001441215.1 hypothetical protein (macronuclear) [Paramecium tetraurelia strain d4-2]
MNTQYMYYQPYDALFQQFQKNGKITRADLKSMLQSINYNDMQINNVLSKVNDDEISKIYAQFPTQIPQPIPQQVDQNQNQQKFTQESQQQIYEEFKTLLKGQEYDKAVNFLQQNKDMDLVNVVDQQSKQICSYIVVQFDNEGLALKFLSLLTDFRVNLNFKDSLKQSILFYICRDGKLKLLDFVLSQNAVNINDQDQYGQTPLFYAARDNKVDIVTRLVKVGANVNLVDTLSNQTALFYSAREGNAEICKILIDNGCNPNHQDQHKKTAQFFAKRFQRKEVMELFNSYFGKNKDDFKQNSNYNNENSRGEQPKQQKKKNKDLPKQAYKLMFTDEYGNLQEITSSEFSKFQQQYPQIANLIINADELIDDNVLNSMKDDDIWEKVAKKVLQILWKAKGAQLFHNPVDEKKYGINDYYDIVKRPMDFGTVKQKLNANQYKNCKEFYHDIMLVFDNCILYNGSENDIGQIGLSLKQEFLNQIEQTGLKKHLQ